MFKRKCKHNNPTDIVYNFGKKCYQAGYRKACREAAFAFAGLTLIQWGMVKLITNHYSDDESEE